MNCLGRLKQFGLLVPLENDKRVQKVVVNVTFDHNSFDLPYI